MEIIFASLIDLEVHLQNTFIISFKGYENSFLNYFKILVGILFRPLALLVFIELVKSSISSGTVGESKIVLLFSGKLCYCYCLQNIACSNNLLSLYAMKIYDYGMI